MRRLALAALAAAGLAAPAGAAEYGLVIGVNDYVFERPLKGAVNDARDIARALQARGPERMVVLLNQSASRDAIEAAWNGLLAEASAGDVIIFTYAGHGGSEPDLNGDEKTALHPDDMQDEAFLLSNFTDATPTGFAERIVDDELNLWFRAAAEKGVRVVFLADACNSGTMTRASGSTRFAGAYAPPSGAEAAPAPPRGDLDNVFFIAGASQDQAVPEIAIAGVMRGAASYAFARALEGAADGNGDGSTTRDEMEGYFSGLLATLSDQARPSILPASRGTAPVFGADIAAAEAPPPPAPAITLAAISGQIGAGWGDDVAAADWGEATLNWDDVGGVVKNAEGDMVARRVFGKIAMRRVVDKFRLLEQVRVAASANPFAATLAGGAATRSVGDRVELVIGARAKPFLTVFTLANDGTAALAYPFDAAEAGPRPPGAAVRFAFEVTEDGVGVEHVVALASDAPPEALRAALATGGPARRFADILTETLAGRDIEAAIAAVATEAR